MSDNDEFVSRLSNTENIVSIIDLDFVMESQQLISLLSPVKTKNDLMRIGGAHDGGYIIVEGWQPPLRAISIGIGNEYSTELQLLEFGFEIIAADGSVSNPFPATRDFQYTNAHIGGGTFENVSNVSFDMFLSRHGWNCNVEIIKIDIEGMEYELLTNHISEICKSRQIIVEFHGLELLGSTEFRMKIINLLRVINKTHKPVHVHGNNGGPGIKLAGGELPTLLEVTFLRNGDCLNERNYGPFPSNLDYPNIDSRPDIDLNVFFGKAPTFMEIPKRILSSLERQ